MTALHAAAAAAERYLSTIDSDLVRRRGADAAAMSLRATFPEDGDGALVAIDELMRAADGAIRNSGPRFFHWVVGGTTPSALAADWLTSTFDQSAFAYESTTAWHRCEQLAVDWLKDLFGLPASWGGVLTTGATMANFTGSPRRAAGGAASRRRHRSRGVGLWPACPSSRAATSIRARRRRSRCSASAETPFAASPATMWVRVDLAALETALRRFERCPRDRRGQRRRGERRRLRSHRASRRSRRGYGSWLHVDGRLGLFARVTARASHLAAGGERAHSVIADGHKWLNVAYDSGFAFVLDVSLWKRIRHRSAVPAEACEHPMFGGRGPEASRRARGIASLGDAARYDRRTPRDGRATSGSRAAARERGGRGPELERLAEVPLNIVCFRFDRGPLGGRARHAEREDRRGPARGWPRLGRDDALSRPSRVPSGDALTAIHRRDIDLIVEVVRELGARLGVTVA